MSFNYLTVDKHHIFGVLIHTELFFPDNQSYVNLIIRLDRELRREREEKQNIFLPDKRFHLNLSKVLFKCYHGLTATPYPF